MVLSRSTCLTAGQRQKQQIIPLQLQKKKKPGIWTKQHYGRYAGKLVKIIRITTNIPGGISITASKQSLLYLWNAVLSMQKASPHMHWAVLQEITRDPDHQSKKIYVYIYIYANIIWVWKKWLQKKL